jgi:arylsulfatase A-like enzyme
MANNMPLPAETTTIAEMLGDAYHRAYFGKWHLGDEIIPQHGFEKWVSIEDGPYRPFYTKPEYLERFSDYHQYLIDCGFAPNASAKGGVRVFSREFTAVMAERHTKAGFLGREAARFLRERNDDRPFLLSVNFLEPHMPFFGPLNDLYDPDHVPCSPSFLRYPGPEATLRHRMIAAEFQAKGEDGFRLTPWRWRRYRANYLGLVTLVDRAVGGILQALDESGQADNTIVVFTSDHGEMMGDHALLGKSVLFEPAVRVPLMIRVPWLTQPRRIDGRISQIDLVPTLLELLGESPPSHLQGSSRADALRGRTSLVNNEVIIEWNPNRISAMAHAPPGFTDEQAHMVDRQSWRSLISAEGWKLNLSDDDLGELYDLNNDPYELRNRINDADQSERVRELTSRIHSWQRNTQDRVVL